MATEQQDFAGGAAASALTGQINNAVTSFTVTSTTGWPSSGLPFTIIVDQGTATEECMFVRSVSGTTVILDSGKGRGYDGTTAQQHSASAPITLSPDAGSLADFSKKLYAMTTLGDLPYCSATSGVQYGRIPVGSTGNILGVSGGIPAWIANPGLLIANNLSDLNSPSAARSNLGLGTAATHAATDFLLSSTITTAGDLIVGTGAAAVARIGIGTNGQVLQSNGTTAAWATLGTASSHAASDFLAVSTVTTNGDLLYATAASTITRLGIGSTNQVLGVVGGVPAWMASPTSVLTSTGDLLYASGANTLARLAVGTAKQVLKGGTTPGWASLIDSWTTKCTPANLAIGVNYQDINGADGANTVAAVTVSGYTKYLVSVSADIKNTDAATHAPSAGVSLDSSMTAVIAEFQQTAVGPATSGIVNFTTVVTLADTGSHTLTINAKQAASATIANNSITAIGIS